MTKTLSIVETAINAGNFTTLVKALTAAGLVETLKGAGPFTVFAPNDEAFAKIPANTLDDLLKPENKEKLKAALTYHVISGKVMSVDAAKLKTAKTLNGQEFKIDASSNSVKINDAKVVTPDLEATNGVIHVIDTVLMPAVAATAS